MRNQTVNNLNYFLSGWMANFGVVPLLLLRAFLLLPALTFLALRLFLVILVFDTIFQLLIISASDQRKYKWNFKYLHSFRAPVKALCLLICLFYQPIGQAFENSLPSEEQVLGIGEIKTINASRIAKYSVGNPQVLRVKINQNQLLIRALAKGSSDILLWKKGQKGPKVLRVFVLSKLKRLSLANLKKATKSLNLKVESIGDQLTIKGEVSDFQHYKKLVALSLNKDLDLSQIEIEKKLQKKIQSLFFKELLLNRYDSFDCQFEGAILKCHYDDTDSPKKKDLSRWKKSFLLRLIPYQSSKFKQYQLSLHILQTENSDGRDIQFGLESIESSWNSLFESGLKGLIQKNQILLKKEKVDIHSLAQPNLIIRPHHPVKIRVGSEVPYQETHKESTSVKWKFAGLDLKIELELIGERLLIKYQSKLNRPSSNGSFSGNSQSSSVLVPLNQPVQLFQIGYQSLNEKEGSLPGLGEIPILGRLFKSQHKWNQYKKINGIIKIKEVYFD